MNRIFVLIALLFWGTVAMTEQKSADDVIAALVRAVPLPAA